MISPERLRRYPFFCCLEEEQLTTLAMLSDEVSLTKGTILFKENDHLEFLYFLTEGSVDLFFTVDVEYNKPKKEFFVDQINPEEVFAISAMIEPYHATSTAKIAQDSKAIKIDAKSLLAKFEGDPRLGMTFLLRITKTAIERLTATRVQLVASRA